MKKLSLEQIREVIYALLDENCDSIGTTQMCYIPICQDNDCRECLMKEFERVADDN